MEVRFARRGLMRLNMAKGMHIDWVENGSKWMRVVMSAFVSILKGFLLKWGSIPLVSTQQIGKHLDTRNSHLISHCSFPFSTPARACRACHAMSQQGFPFLTTVAIASLPICGCLFFASTFTFGFRCSCYSHYNYQNFPLLHCIRGVHIAVFWHFLGVFLSFFLVVFWRFSSRLQFSFC